MLPNIDRRQLLGQVGLGISGVALGAMLPGSLLQAGAPAACLVDASSWPDPCGDWQLDDICNAYPTYSLHPAPPVPVVAPIRAGVDPADVHWVA